MTKRLSALALFPLFLAVSSDPQDQPWTSTRIEDPAQHRRKGPQNHPHRSEPHLGFILRHLDVRPGDTVVDVGAGDGFWSEHLAGKVGPDGTVWAAEITRALVDKLAARFAGKAHVKPRLIPTDRIDLPEGSADLAFFSLVYHHLPEDRAGYLRRLRSVMKPTGRLAIVERYSNLLSDPKVHGAAASALFAAAESAGWVPLRYELLTGTNHYLAIFAQKDLFDEDKPASRPPKRP